jgi:hypothetical protein
MDLGLEIKYRIAIVKNRKIYKVIQDYKILKHALNKFNKIKEENQVFYEKKFKNYKKIQRIVYEILLLEKCEGEKKFRKVINGFGEFVEEKITGNWIILKKFHQKEEENFHVYGLNRRLFVPDIIAEVIMPRISTYYQIVMVFNKIVLYDDNDIEVILCKNIDEAERLYGFLFNLFLSKGVLNLIFLGKANQKTRSSLYDRIQAHTGLTRKEMYRTSTRS